MRERVKSLLCAAVVGSACFILSGCFTTAYDNRHQQAYLKYSEEYSKVVLQDEVSAIALLPKRKNGELPVVFVGKQHSYVVTSGGAALMEVARSLLAEDIRLNQNPTNARLTLVGSQFTGRIELDVFIKNANKDNQRIANALGFAPMKESTNPGVSDPNGFTAYHRRVNVAGYLAAPAHLSESQLTKPLQVDFWGPLPSWHNPRNSVGHAASMTLDILASPLYVIGAVAGITVLSVACSTSHNKQPCIE